MTLSVLPYNQGAKHDFVALVNLASALIVRKSIDYKAILLLKGKSLP